MSSNEHINILPFRLLKEKIQHGCGDRALETQEKNKVNNEVSEPENEEEDNNVQTGDKNEDTEGQANNQAFRIKEN